jgi:hypothetical protein
MRSMRGGFISRSRGPLYVPSEYTWRLSVFLSLYHFVGILLSFPFLISSCTCTWSVLSQRDTEVDYLKKPQTSGLEKAEDKWNKHGRNYDVTQ